MQSKITNVIIPSTINIEIDELTLMGKKHYQVIGFLRKPTNFPNSTFFIHRFPHEIIVNKIWLFRNCYLIISDLYTA